VIKLTIKLSLCFLLTEHDAIEAYWGNGGIALRILDLDTLDGGEWLLSRPDRFTPRYPLDRRLGGFQSPFGCGGEEKNSQPLPGLELPIIQPAPHHWAIWAPDKTDCSNYKRISLLPTTYKMLCNSLVPSLAPELDENDDDLLCGFRSHRPTADHIFAFVVRYWRRNGNILEQYLSFQGY
jgi:hypothetical protein